MIRTQCYYSGRDLLPSQRCTQYTSGLSATAMKEGAAGSHGIGHLLHSHRKMNQHRYLGPHPGPRAVNAVQVGSRAFTSCLVTESPQGCSRAPDGN